MATADIDTTVGTQAVGTFNASAFMEMANLMSNLESEGLTLEDLLEVAKNRKTQEKLETTPAPQIVYVTTQKPDLEPLSIADAYEEYIYSTGAIWQNLRLHILAGKPTSIPGHINQSILFRK